MTTHKIDQRSGGEGLGTNRKGKTMNKQLADILEKRKIDIPNDDFNLEKWMIGQGYIGLTNDPDSDDCYCFIEDDTIGACGEGCGSCYPVTKEPND